jgi:threonylcarbamoyladenosine tRNA methylthiotransferase CDKAL1
MGDIEEIGRGVDVPRGNDKDMNKALVFPKKNMSEASCHSEGVDECKSSVPGTQKIWVKTYGCSHNVSDSEYMEGILSNFGYRMEANKDDADLWLINSCTVKDPSEAAFMHLVNKGKEIKKPVVVAGCVSQADQSIKGLEDVSVVGIANIDRVVEVVEQTLEGHIVKMTGKKSLPSLDLPKVRRNPLVEIIPLSTGCLGSCTYCKTKHARGKLGSYALDAIVERAKIAISEGVAEIWLSSEDTGAYGIDLGTNIGELLLALIAILPDERPDGSGSVMLRVGMTNPPFILEHLEVVAKVLNHPKVFAFLHVPVQAGSNRVLLAMNREYTVEEYRRVCDYLIENVPEMTVATDIICGFPTETEADFDLTMNLIDDYKLAITNISQFYPRPGTPAAKMKRIKTQIVKNRSRRLTKVFESFDPYQHFPGQMNVKVWFNTEISDDGAHSVGHTKGYVKVLVPLDPSLPGTSKYVDVHSHKRFHINATLCTDQVKAGTMHAANTIIDSSSFKLNNNKKSTLSSLFNFSESNVTNTTVALAGVAVAGVTFAVVMKYMKKR